MCEIVLIHTKPNFSSVKLIKPNTSSARWVTGELCICFILKFGFCLSLPSPICLLHLSLFPHLHFYLVCALPSSSPHPFLELFNYFLPSHYTLFTYSLVFFIFSGSVSLIPLFSPSPVSAWAQLPSFVLRMALKMLVSLQWVALRQTGGKRC